jgi:transcriptional regulator with XRE-family HTH domain
MSKKRKEETMSFGARLADLRKAAGFTQQQLADEIEVSRRMLAYYEVQSEHPPTHLLPAIARALQLSTDELLGLVPAKRAAKAAKPANSRLQRRLAQIEKLEPTEKRQILQVLDTLIESARFKHSLRSKQPA